MPPTSSELTDGLPEKLDIERLRDHSLIRDHGGSISGIPGHLVSCPELNGREFIVPLGTLIPYPGQPRQFLPVADVRRLSETLKSKGQLTPMIVTPYWRGSDQPLVFLIVDGEMRFRALGVAEMEDAFVVVHPYLNEAKVYEAAAATHKDDTTLGPTDRALMLARLYELKCVERKSTDGSIPPVSEFAQEISVGYNDVHNALRIKALPSRIVEWGVKRLIVYSGLVYLGIRLREYKQNFPEEKLIQMLQRAIEKKGRESSLSEEKVTECFEHALILSGQGDEAVRLNTRRKLLRFMQTLFRASREGDSLLEEAEEEGEEGEEDSVIVGLLGKEIMSPGELDDLEAMNQHLSKQLSVFAHLIALSKTLGGRKTRRPRNARKVKKKPIAPVISS